MSLYLKYRCASNANEAQIARRESERRMTELKVENARLREYARALTNAITSYGCDLCPHEEGCYVETDLMGQGCKLRHELCELGIEMEE